MDCFSFGDSNQLAKKKKILHIEAFVRTHLEFCKYLGQNKYGFKSAQLFF